MLFTEYPDPRLLLTGDLPAEGKRFVVQNIGFLRAGVAALGQEIVVMLRSHFDQDFHGKKLNQRDESPSWQVAKLVGRSAATILFSRHIAYRSTIWFLFRGSPTLARRRANPPPPMCRSPSHHHTLSILACRSFPPYERRWVIQRNREGKFRL